MIQPFDANYFMRQAIEEARYAIEKDEVPVGAVITFNNRIIARAHNEVERLNDVTAHAEILVITAAANALGTKYLKDCKLYVTLEPCIMCAGALYWSQIGHVIYGAEDEKRGFMREGRHLLHPNTKIEFGLEQETCSGLMKSFFARKRLKI